jgi:type VI secretion system protein ImpA
MLDDPNRGLCFPNIIRTIPVLGSGASASSAVEWERLIVSKETKDEQAVDAILSASRPEDLQNHIADAEACLEELRTIQTCLEQKLGNLAPGFVYLGQSIDEVGKLAGQVLRQIGGAPNPAEQGETSGDGDQGAQAANGATSTTVDRQSRREAYEQIDRAAEVLRRLEPHSPVPYLVRRAVSLGRMPFPTLIKQLVREESILSELYRELGIVAGESDDVQERS